MSWTPANLTSKVLYKKPKKKKAFMKLHKYVERLRKLVDTFFSLSLLINYLVVG